MLFGHSKKGSLKELTWFRVEEMEEEEKKAI